MRYSFIYSALYLSTFAFFTAAAPPGWNEAQSKTCLPFDLNVLPAEEIPPESLSSSDVPIASYQAMDNLIAPSRFTPQGLAANNHVFSGVRGLPSADVEEYPERGKPDDDQHQFLRHLNQCKGERDLESFFFIQRDPAGKFMYNYLCRKRRFEFNFPPKIPPGRRLGMLFETLLRLSDKKISLDGNHFFENQIIGGMRERLATNFENTQNPSSPNIKTIMRFVQDVTEGLLLVQTNIPEATNSLFKKVMQNHLHASARETALVQ
ncbi:hypothetical protein VP01_245g4 [Puccinia sorghi]|uniref:Uncharacterized protein n=1 Tax=Puccinia sorghi TaxID=27349 RepID=A0A0L6V7X9_9BASI|nr:hypothetical protein VP01_245g4 [Puccinia sorghi]